MEILKQKFKKEILDYLEQTKFEDEISNKFKGKLISKLHRIYYDVTLTEEIFEKYKNIINNFISTEIEKNLIKNENILNWSLPLFKEIGNYSDEMKIIEQILWYSKFYQILKKLDNNVSLDDIKYFAREILSQNDEMYEVGNYIWDRSFLGIDRKTNKNIFSSFNANFIKRLIDSELFKYIDKLDEIINHFAYREKIDNITFYWEII